MLYDVRQDPWFDDAVNPQAVLLVSQYMLTLFENPDRWTKDAFARRSDGSRTTADKPDAVCFCLTGGIERASLALGLSFKDYNTAWKAFEAKTKGITMFNDNPETSFDDVVSVIKQVIHDAAV